MAIYVSAAHKSSGKTTVSIGLCAAMANRGLVVQPFKKGPDYIDPLWLGVAARRPCVNLDFFTSANDEIKATFESYSRGSDGQLVEGNKGLFDGVSLDGSDSNAAMARLLGLPVILVIDAQGMTRGVAPLLLGYQKFDERLEIAGVVFNRVGGERHEAKLLSAVGEYTDLDVLGAVRKFRGESIQEKHLGLIPANEDEAANRKIDELAGIIEQSADVDRIASLVVRQSAARPPGQSAPSNQQAPSTTTRLRIGIAKDAAFGFYYHDDLMAFEREGVELIPFSPLADHGLPEVDGLFIGGGFPERHLAALEANGAMRNDIRRAVENGMPVYAECGGLMYLTREIEWQGKKGEGVGVIPARVIMSALPQGRGYMQLRETGNGLWPEHEASRVINAHEFHYSRLTDLPDDMTFAYDVVRGEGIKGGKDGIVYKNLLASYCHLRDQKQHHWVQRFVAFVRERIAMNANSPSLRGAE